MEDPKDGVLPLVGRVLKKRLSELKDETVRELREGYDEFREELRRDLDGSDSERSDSERSAGESSAEEATGPVRVRVPTDAK